MTMLVLDWVKSKREGLKESFAQGSYAASFDGEYIARHSAAAGACSAYEEVLNVNIEDVQSELENE